MNILPNILTAPMAASLLSGLLAFAPNPMLSQIGLAGSMGLGGYAVATSKTDPRRQKQEKGMSTDCEVRRLKQELADVQTRIRNLSRDKKVLAAELIEVQAARAGLINKVKALETVAGDKAINPFVDICEYTQQLQTLKAQIADKDAQVAELATALEAANDGTAARVAAVKAETLLTGSTRLELEAEIEALTEDKRKLTAAYHSFDNALKSAGLKYDAELSELGGIKEAQDEKSMETIQHWKQQAANLTARISELEAEAKKPARFGGTGAADVMGNMVIDFFRSKGYEMLPHETDPDLDKGLMVSLDAKTPIDLKTAQQLMGELEVFTKTHSTPQCSYEGRYYRFRLAVNEPFRAASEAKLTSNLKRLKKAIDLANHLSIFGGSGSGKSTFLDNAIWCGRCLWPDSKLDVLDPKYPFTKWSSLKPTYKGGEATIDGVISISQTMNNRLEDATKRFDETGIVPEYPRYIFAIDEATVALTEAKRLDQVERKGEKLAVNFGASLSSLLRLGRALNVKGYFLTQSLLVSKVGLNEGDYDNTTRIYLNAMIEKALDKELKELFSENKITAIRRELQRRKDANHDYIGLVADTNRDEIFLFEPPAPGFYYEQYQAENRQENSTPLSASKGQLRTAAPKPAKPANAGVPECAADAEKCTDEAPAPAPHSSAPTPAQLRAKCPKCSEGSTELERAQPLKSGKYRFKCQNDACKTKTFSALPE